MKSRTSGRRCWSRAFSLALLCGTLAAAAQSAPAIRVTTCQLEARPGAYDGKTVEVRGRIYFGKFDFVIDSDCQPHGGRVWVDLGGDVRAPGAYWGISSSLPKQKGVDVRVRRISVPLVRDSRLDQFVNDVGATRFRKPNGDACGSECLFYEVTATVRGMFFSGTKGGFGMERCCHLLVIESVLGVSSKRTRVPAGGEFACTSDRWQPSAEEWKAFSAKPACSLRENFNNCSVYLAKHWGDAIRAGDRLDYPGDWMSPDMTLSYKFAGGFIQERGQPMTIKPSSTVTRESCRAVTLPLPASDPIHCDFFRSGWLEDKNAIIAVEKEIAAGKADWRLTDMVQVGWLAYQEVAEGQKLTTATLPSAGCEQGTMAETNQPWAVCNWLSRDGLREVMVDLHKPLYLKKPGSFDKVPWVATGTEANQCHPER